MNEGTAQEEQARPEIPVSGADIRTYTETMFARYSALDPAANPVLDLPVDQSVLGQGITKALIKEFALTRLRNSPSAPSRLLPYQLLEILTGVKVNAAGDALTNYTGNFDEFKELRVVTDEQTVAVTATDMSQAGAVVGELMANHALVKKPLSQMIPDRGNLVRQRFEMSKFPKTGGLQLLDTILFHLRRLDVPGGPGTP